MERLLPLPDCEGPKLEPFVQNFEDLEFEPERVLGDLDGNYHGTIIKAKLDGKLYGIKFFRSLHHVFKPKDYPELTNEESALAKIQCNPFYAECRAYGRLKETGQEHLAAKAYGYVQVFINDRTEEMFKPAYKLCLSTPANGYSGLRDFFDVHDTDEDGDATEPVMGIVKEWAGNGDDEWGRLRRELGSWEEWMKDVVVRGQEFTDELPRLLSNLHQLHKHGIVVRDIHPNQYVEGKLVDLGHAMTVPHVLGQGDRDRPEWTFASYAARDLYDFQKFCIDFHEEAITKDLKEMRKHGMEPPEYRKSKLVAYPKPDAFARGKHRYLPLLSHSPGRNQQMNPKGPHFIPWTYGPRYDPAQFQLKKTGDRTERKHQAHWKRRTKWQYRPHKKRDQDAWRLSPTLIIKGIFFICLLTLLNYVGISALERIGLLNRRGATPR